MTKHQELATILAAHADWLSSMHKQGKRADLSGANLDGFDFSGKDLNGALFSGASLRAANFSHCQLIHVDFSDADLQGASFTGANLLLSNFSGGELQHCTLSNTVLRPSEDWGQTCRGPCFRDANLSHADLTASDCCYSDFSGATLMETCFSAAQLEHANLSQNQLCDLDFAAARMSHVDLSASNLRGANLNQAQLIHANLSRCNLSNADVRGAQLQSANLAETKVDQIRYDRHARFQGIRVESCYGSSRFKRHAQDQDYIEEFKAAHPKIYTLWLWSTDCGRSLSRVALWSLLFAVLFGCVYYSLGHEAFEVTHHETLSWSLFTTIYYSVVTFTTLGFGDITPRTPLAASFVILEVIVGYLMLGILISILANKVARRS